MTRCRTTRVGLAVAMAIVVAVALCGCGGQEPDSTPAPTEATTTSTKTTTKATMTTNTTTNETTTNTKTTKKTTTSTNTTTGEATAGRGADATQATTSTKTTTKKTTTSTKTTTKKTTTSTKTTTKKTTNTKTTTIKTTTSTRATTKKTTTRTTTYLSRAMPQGECCCPDDDKIETEEECEIAVNNEKPGTTMGWIGSDALIPGGCSIKVWRDGSWHGHWNKVREGVQRRDMIPVCKPKTYRSNALPQGECCCPGDDKIQTKWDCEFAVNLEKPGTTMGWIGSDPAIPGGCSIKVWPDGSWHGHWNEVRTGKKRKDMIPLCKPEIAVFRLFDDTIHTDPLEDHHHGAWLAASLSGGALLGVVGLAVLRRRGRMQVDGMELILGEESELTEA